MKACSVSDLHEITTMMVLANQGSAPVIIGRNLLDDGGLNCEAIIGMGICDSEELPISLLLTSSGEVAVRMEKGGNRQPSSE